MIMKKEMKRKILAMALSISVLTGMTFVAPTEMQAYAAKESMSAKTAVAIGKITESANLTTAEKAARASISNYLKSLEANRNFSGQILVERNGKVIIDRAYGYADYENKRKAQTSTTFCIGSVTKQFTAAAISQLVEKGKLSYEDKISKYLKNVPYGDKISIHQLLTHTSGLYDYTNSPVFLSLDPEKITFENLIALIKDKPLGFEPGQGWSYCNTGYLVLGKIVEDISGMTLENYLKNNIFKPIGMSSTKAAYAGKKKIVDSNGYNGYMEVTPDMQDTILLNAAFGAGYLCSTAEDLLKWDRALLAGKVVPQAQLDKIFGEQAFLSEKMYYGYGWFVSDSEYGKAIGHGGNTIGFTAENGMFLDKRIKVIILVNKGYASLNDIERTIIKSMDGKKITNVEKYRDYKITAQEMDRLTGSYMGGGINVSISRHEGVLEAMMMGRQFVLWATSDRSFYAKDGELEMEFAIGSDGKASSINMSALGDKVILEKQVEKASVEVSLDQLNKYVGDYEIKGVLNINVKVVDGKLMLQGTGQPAFEVKPISETQFEAQAFGIEIEFNSKDNPDRFIMKQQGMEFTALRIK